MFVLLKSLTFFFKPHPLLGAHYMSHCLPHLGGVDLGLWGPKPPAKTWRPAGVPAQMGRFSLEPEILGFFCGDRRFWGHFQTQWSMKLLAISYTFPCSIPIFFWWKQFCRRLVPKHWTKDHWTRLHWRWWRSAQKKIHRGHGWFLVGILYHRVSFSTVGHTWAWAEAKSGLDLTHMITLEDSKTYNMCNFNSDHTNHIYPATAGDDQPYPLLN